MVTTSITSSDTVVFARITNIPKGQYIVRGEVRINARDLLGNHGFRIGDSWGPIFGFSGKYGYDGLVDFITQYNSSFNLEYAGQLTVPSGTTYTVQSVNLQAWKIS